MLQHSQVAGDILVRFRESMFFFTRYAWRTIYAKTKGCDCRWWLCGHDVCQGSQEYSVDVLLIDRRNFHLFQPLLYQVATGGLSPANIAAPLRSIFRRQPNVQVIMGSVASFDREASRVMLEDGTSRAFDYLVVATGSTHHYFGKDSQWESIAPGLKTIEDATKIRRKFCSPSKKRNVLMTPKRSKAIDLCSRRRGPTGVEMAGSIAELSKQTMRRDFRSIDPTKARVILVENSHMCWIVTITRSRFEPQPICGPWYRVAQ